MTIQVREAVSDVDLQAWLTQLAGRLSASEPSLLQQALALALELYPGHRRADGELLLTHCREVAAIVATLELDAESIAAALVSGMPAVASNWSEVVTARLGPGVAALVEGTERMEQIRDLRGKVERNTRPEQRAAQLEALRKLLLAMVQDVRVVLVALADQTQRLRYLAGFGTAPARTAAAQDTFDLFAPLANRLGVWQLKWELEDLGFRCAEPERYKAIARELDEKRPDRESFIAQVTQRLREALSAAGIAAEVTGRPKHIYSIHRKLARKQFTLAQLFDVRGVRVLVEDVKDCYATLGLVHNLWTPLPGEFDDYIAKPKPNNYRSLHTAVVGPDGKVLEVQIRTHAMHQQCEYGVAAHWRYKEQGRRESAGRRGAAAFEQDVDRMNERLVWLRQILEWRDGLADVADLAESLRSGLFEDTIYVLTPQGRVIDLPRGATPVDFAYHVHSALGHRCRGAKVDGQIVPLSHALDNGQTVEIIAASSGGPSRDWLNPELGFLRSARARAKVRQWFNTQNLEAALAQGRQVIEKALQREGMTALALDRLAGQLHYAKADDLLAAVGRSELTSRQLQGAIQALAHPSPAPAAAEALPAIPAQPQAAAPAPRPAGEILIVGVDRLLTSLARCCRPAPPDAIIGFVTRGKGVSIHRRSCVNVARLPAQRLIEAQWGADAGSGSFQVDIEVVGDGDPRFTRDVLDALVREHARVLAARPLGREPDARLAMTVELSGEVGLDRILALLRQLPRVRGARRR
jgi:GTP pyrophosphokinase